MTFCPECGKPVAPKAKFCRNCGASQLDEALSATVSEPVATPLAAPPVPSPTPAPVIPAQPPAPPAPPQVVTPPVSQFTCNSCGSPLSPSEKFCGVCGARAGPIATVLSAPAPAAPVSVPPAPAAPAMGQPSGARTCSACGNVIKPGDKYCSKCLAIVRENPPQETASYPPPVAVPAPSQVPIPAPVMGQPSGARTCSACGNVIKPGDKYCSKCLAIVRDNPLTTAVPAASPHTQAPGAVPVNYQVPIPAPVMGQPTGARTCSACGNAIKPGDKYCSKCLAIVRDNPLPAAAPAVSPVQPSPAAAPGSYVCASCGSPVSGTEKFCGICGAPVVATRVPAAVPPQPVQKTCSACGAPVNDTTKFCGGCGAPVGASFRPAEVAQPAFAPYAGVASAVPQGTEQVIGVIGNARKMKMLGASWDTYALVVTDRRFILAQITSDMLNAASREAAAEAKAQGTGFLGQMAHQMSAFFRYCQRYETMPPDLILAETQGNRAIENARISAVNIKVKGGPEGSSEYNEFIMTLVSADGKFEFHIGEDDRFINILKTAYGDRVHMPFGYFRVGGARISLF